MLELMHKMAGNENVRDILIVFRGWFPDPKGVLGRIVSDMGNIRREYLLDSFFRETAILIQHEEPVSVLSAPKAHSPKDFFVKLDASYPSVDMSLRFV